LLCAPVKAPNGEQRVERAVAAAHIRRLEAVLVVEEQRLVGAEP